MSKKLRNAVDRLVQLLALMALVGGTGLLLNYPFMWLVNYTFSPKFLLTVFGGPLTYWKAYWFTTMASLLTSNWRSAFDE